jgi:hypothetical protein
MAQQLFNRIGSIAVHSPKMPASTAREFTGLRFAFNIEKTAEPANNTAKFTIWNLSKNSRALFEEKDAVVICKLGYSGIGTYSDGVAVSGQNLAEQTFIGNIIENGIRLERTGGDIALNIECATAAVATRDSVVNKSFGEGTPIISIVNELASILGIKISNIPVADFGVALNGASLSGNVKDMMTTLLGKNGMTWSVQDDELQITQINKPTTEQAVIMNSYSGLIGVPTKRQDGTLFFTSLLNPKLKPNRIVLFGSREINGTFRVQKVTHTGDLEAGKFDSIVEAKEL